jgi:hypothetical protein
MPQATGYVRAELHQLGTITTIALAQNTGNPMLSVNTTNPVLSENLF